MAKVSKRKKAKQKPEIFYLRLSILFIVLIIFSLIITNLYMASSGFMDSLRSGRNECIFQIICTIQIAFRFLSVWFCFIPTIALLATSIFFSVHIKNKKTKILLILIAIAVTVIGILIPTIFAYQTPTMIKRLDISG